MNIDRTTVLSVALTVILVTSMFPADIVGTADAMPHSPSRYTVIQGTNCWEVNPYHPGDTNPEGPGSVQPHVEVIDHSHELGSFRNSSWDGTPTVESVMAYRYRDPEGGVHDNAQAWGQRHFYAPQLAEGYWKEPWSFGTYGLWNWSENRESHMFFYNGPEGDSLVMRHDKLYDDTPIGSHDPYNGRNGPQDGFMSPQPGGGSVSFIFRDLPAGEWAYMDDMYPEDMDDRYYASGEFDYNSDRHTIYGHRNNDYGAAPLENYGGGTDFTAHWMWGDNGTDGGAYRGLQNLGPGESVVIEPYFDEESYFWSNHPWWYDRSEGDGITDWVIRRKGEDNIRLDKTEPVEIRRGSHCPDAEFGFGTNSGTARVEVGEQFAIDGRASEGNSIQYNWDLDGDGQFEDNTTSAVFSHAYDGSVPENVSVTLMVEDSDGLQSTVTKQIRVVPAESPDASVSIGGTNQNSLDEYHVPNETLTFDATNTTDNGVLNASSAVWRVNGNVTAEGQMQYSQAFGETGEYRVSFTVGDEAGHSTTETMTVSVDALDTQNPNANAQVTPREVEAGANVTFDGSGSDDNRGIQTYRWDVNGDGSFEQSTSTPTFNYVYGSQNTHNVTLEVEDANNNVDNTTVPVTVMQSESPNVTGVSFPDEVTLDEEFTLRADATDNGRITDYTWQIISGDAPEATGNPATYTFSEDFDQLDGERAFSVVVYVTDAAGNTEPHPVEKRITVLPRDETAPDASLSVSTNQTRVGNDVTFNASESTDERNITAYHWDFDGDDSPDRTTENPVVSHSYGSTGTYNATVMVDDGSDSSSNGTATVQIEVEQEQQAQQDSSGGSSVNTGPPPVDTDTEQTGPNAAAIDVQNGQADKTIASDLPESEVASETGVSFERVAVDLASDDPHVVFETAASADPPESVTELSAADETLVYLELDAKYLDDGVENATVEFTVQKSALGELAESSDVVVYQYTDSWEQVDATVVGTTEDGYRLTATADELGTLAVGTNQPLSVAEVGLGSDAVTTGETVTATATVENTGTTARSATLNLTLDGNVVASETVEVAPGETEEVTLSGTAPTTGTYEATVGGVSAGTLTVEDLQPADVSVADVSLNASTIDAGEQVAITATVENTGDEAGEQTVTLTLFGEELESETVQVPGGEKREITFVRQIDAAGTYTVDVNGETAEIEVKGDSNDGGLGDKAPDVPGFGVGAALAALLAAALLARLRN